MGQVASLKWSLSKTDSRLILAIASLLLQVFTTILFVGWCQYDMAQYFFTGMSPMTILAFKWYFESKTETTGK